MCAINHISARVVAVSCQRRNTVNLKLTPPKEITFWIAVVLGILALLSFLGTLTILPIAPFWLLFIAFALLVVALLVKGL
jgi:hypothetical protein